MNNFTVYLITFPNNKKYVGITSRNFEIRKREHENSSINKTSKIIKAILEMEQENLLWNILKVNLSKKLAKEYEKYYIKKYDTFNNGYNSTKGGEGLFGYKFTAEQKKRQSQRSIGFKWTEKQKELHSKRLKKYYEKNYPYKAIENLKKFKTENKKQYDELRNAALRKYENRLKNSRRNGGKPILVYDLNNNLIGRWEIISDCARQLNLRTSKICLCLQGKRNKHRGYKFKYETK